jgi:hypothetical protein
MKKLVLALVAIAFIGTWCFAQTESVVKNLTGKIESITPAGKKDTHSEITVAADSGQKVSLTVRSSTVILAKDGSALTLGDLKKGSKVFVEYVALEDGINKASAIQLVE